MDNGGTNHKTLSIYYIACYVISYYNLLYLHDLVLCYHISYYLKLFNISISLGSIQSYNIFGSIRLDLVFEGKRQRGRKDLFTLI